MKRSLWIALLFLAQVLLGSLIIPPAHAWFDETHIAVAKVAGYSKWFNACGPDMIKVKMGKREGHNHYVNNPRGTVVTPEMVMAQVEKYDQIDEHGHLYGAIIASVTGLHQGQEEGEVRGVPHGLLCPLRGGPVPAPP